MNSKPVLRQTLPKRIPGNNQFPGELVEIEDSDEHSTYVPIDCIHDRKVVDHCLLIDSLLGIYARERACDTIYLKRDRSESTVVFKEC